jgi:hypothetical protein
MIKYKNEWDEDEILYIEHLPEKIKFTVSTKHKSKVFCVPLEYKELLLELINNIKE